MEKVSNSRVDIRIGESTCPQNEIWRKVFHLQAGTNVRIYVGKVKPTLPLPMLPMLLYPFMWYHELNIEISAADDNTLQQWEYFRELSMADTFQREHWERDLK
jgi:hypothetical protein